MRRRRRLSSLSTWSLASERVLSAKTLYLCPLEWYLLIKRDREIKQVGAHSFSSMLDHFRTQERRLFIVFASFVLSSAQLTLTCLSVGLYVSKSS